MRRSGGGSGGGRFMVMKSRLHFRLSGAQRDPTRAHVRLSKKKIRYARANKTEMTEARKKKNADGERAKQKRRKTGKNRNEKRETRRVFRAQIYLPPPPSVRPFVLVFFFCSTIFVNVARHLHPAFCILYDFPRSCARSTRATPGAPLRSCVHSVGFEFKFSKMK